MLALTKTLHPSIRATYVLIRSGVHSQSPLLPVPASSARLPHCPPPPARARALWVLAQYEHFPPAPQDDAAKSFLLSRDSSSSLPTHTTPGGRSESKPHKLKGYIQSPIVLISIQVSASLVEQPTRMLEFIGGNLQQHLPDTFIVRLCRGTPHRIRASSRRVWA